jgi:hypothetical protein
MTSPYMTDPKHHRIQTLAKCFFYMFSGIYSPLMLNMKSEISPMPLETNTNWNLKTIILQIEGDPDT